MFNFKLILGLVSAILTLLMPSNVNADAYISEPSLFEQRDEAFSKKLTSNPNFKKAKAWDYMQFYKDQVHKNNNTYTDSNNGIIKRYGANNIAVSAGNGSTIIVNQIISGDTYAIGSNESNGKR